VRKLIKVAADVAATTVGIVALGIVAPPPAHADLDPSDYYAELRKDGFLVNGNENYLMGLAMTVCNLKDAGYQDNDIGDYIARRENMSNIQGYTLFLDADIYVCALLHPRLVPLSPLPPPPVQLPPGYRDGD
jgi:hypothetical protein